MPDTAPQPQEGRVKVYGTNDPVAASFLVALLEDQGIPALQLTRPDVYFGAGGMWYPEAYQVLVRESEAESRREDIEAAIAEVEGAEPHPLAPPCARGRAQAGEEESEERP